VTGRGEGLCECSETVRGTRLSVLVHKVLEPRVHIAKDDGRVLEHLEALREFLNLHGLRGKVHARNAVPAVTQDDAMFCDQDPPDLTVRIV
jgi:hypothetical protein